MRATKGGHKGFLVRTCRLRHINLAPIYSIRGLRDVATVAEAPALRRLVAVEDVRVDGEFLLDGHADRLAGVGAGLVEGPHEELLAVVAAVDLVDGSAVG